VNHWMPATGIPTKLPVARLEPAVGVMPRRAPPAKLRQVEECPSCPEYQIHNPCRVRDRQQVLCLPPGKSDIHSPAPGVHFVRSAVLGEHQQSHSPKAREET
jgi:hypothetical protein